ncbi:hypothetical protein JVT61DRAFT_3545 [Boletus reticuloceps]|uniref:Uncharacterized protein n=1 Tax=Boletus reticuloceps TaxID=495285 RepID=A0A8I3A9N2_9AGAM|nr:hypothetical protein JVT61DRAFT_3545 [Boletus reticuloceps]
MCAIDMYHGCGRGHGWIGRRRRRILAHVTDPTSSGYTAIGLGIAAVLSVVAKYTIVPPKYHVFVPNFNAIGIGFILSASFRPSLTLTHARHATHRAPTHHDTFCYAIAAGFIAGEGLGGIVNAILTIAGVGGAKYGSSVGCPGGVYCG